MKAILGLSLFFGLGCSMAMAELPGAFSLTGSMGTARAAHTATLLPNGKVLIAGGYTNTVDAPLATAELYDPAKGTFSPTGDMSIGRASHAAVLLANGKVLMAGGYSGTGASYGTLASAELYDPATGKFTPTGSMTAADAPGRNAIVLRDGRIFIAIAGTFGEIYDPATGMFTATDSYKTSGGLQVDTDVLLPDGRVLIVGCTPFCYDQANELYNPVANTFSIAEARDGWGTVTTPTLLTNGKVLLVEGNCFGTPDEVEVYDPVTGKFSDIGQTNSAHEFSAGVLLRDGTFLVTGGQYLGGNGSASAELYIPATGSFVSGGMLSGRHSHTATLLSDGNVLLTGGFDNWPDPISSAEIYTPKRSQGQGQGQLTSQ
jgi:hypothetical protein